MMEIVGFFLGLMLIAISLVGVASCAAVLYYLWCEFFGK